MSTRNFKNDPNDGQAVDDLEIPPCTIEDVDRSLFDLFNSQLPFLYKHKQGTRRAPVIFATGERFAVLRRRKPLRDKAGALILPLISIMRTGVDQAPTMGAGTSQTPSMVIKRRLSAEDPLYQRLVNQAMLKNSDDLASELALDKRQGALSGSQPGRVATRRPPTKSTFESKSIPLQNPLGNNLFEVITMPPPKYYTAKYEVTFWAQYTVQMNDMLSALMTLYQAFSQRTFKLETPKGYWFVGYIGESLTPGNNFDDFTDSERLVRYSFDVTVPAYLLGSTYPGAKNTLKKFLSAPQINFNTDSLKKDFEATQQMGIPSGDPGDYILEDIRTFDEALPGQDLGGRPALRDSRRVSEHRLGPDDNKNSVAGIGGAFSDELSVKTIEFEKDPFTGKAVKKKTVVKTRISRKGETVLREIAD